MSWSSDPVKSEVPSDSAHRTPPVWPAKSPAAPSRLHALHVKSLLPEKASALDTVLTARQ
eukprot:2111718-Prymnesium_polylepis.1